MDEEPPCLPLGQETDTASWFLQHMQLRRTVEPFPLVPAFAQNRADQRERPIKVTVRNGICAIAWVTTPAVLVATATKRSM